jgi:hypothetical protein
MFLCFINVGTYGRLKSILGIRISVSLVPDLFGQIRNLERIMAVRCPNFQARSQIGIRVVVKSAKYESALILHVWIDALYRSCYFFLSYHLQINNPLTPSAQIIADLFEIFPPTYTCLNNEKMFSGRFF